MSARTGSRLGGHPFAGTVSTGCVDRRGGDYGGNALTRCSAEALRGRERRSPLSPASLPHLLFTGPETGRERSLESYRSHP